MTWQMMLALTVPPSAAYLLARCVAWLEETARNTNAADIEAFRQLKERVKMLEACDDVTQGAFKQVNREHAEHAAELKRLNEQLTTLSERFYQR